MRLEPTVAEQRQLDNLFWNFLTAPHRNSLSDVILFAHRIMDGTVIRRLRKGASTGLLRMYEFITGERDQDISEITFDITKFESPRATCLYYWVNSAVVMMNSVDPCDCSQHAHPVHPSERQLQLEQDCDASLELLRRSRAITLNATTNKDGIGALSVATRSPYVMRMLLKEPILVPGWSLSLKPNGLSSPLDLQNDEDSASLTNTTPLLRSLIHSNQEQQENEQLRPQLIDIMSDEGINSFHPLVYNALWWSIRYSKLATLRALLLRPSLDTTQSELRGAFTLIQRTDICAHQRVMGVFDEVANHFAVLPIMMHQIVIDAYGIVIPHPICQIVANYYRMSYPLCFYASAKQRSFYDGALEKTPHATLAPDLFTAEGDTAARCPPTDDTGKKADTEAENTILFRHYPPDSVAVSEIFNAVFGSC